MVFREHFARVEQLFWSQSWAVALKEGNFVNEVIKKKKKKSKLVSVPWYQEHRSLMAESAERGTDVEATRTHKHLETV